MDLSSVALLQRVPIFAGLDADALQVLAGRSRRRRFGANEALFHKGDPGQTLYIVVSGRVNIQNVTISGEVVHVAQRGPGEVFGELALFDSKPRMADSVTGEPCELLMLDRTEFIRCVEESPRIAINVMACLGDRLREAAEQHESRQELDVTGRVAERILELAEAHGVAEGSGEIRLVVKVTQQAIAEHVGTTRESVNRALAALKEVQAIRFEGRQLIIRNMEKLQRRCAK